MNIFKNFIKKQNVTKRESFKMVTEIGNGFYSFNGKLYKSDIIRACIRPKVKAVGKLLAKHVKSDGSKVSINEIPYIRFLLEEPNPYMSSQMLQEKITTQLSLNNNAFVLIVRDELGVICQLYSVPTEHVEAIYINQELHYKFLSTNGKSLTAKYTEVIHIREDFNSNDVFGESPSKALFDMLNVVTIIDQSIINAIKNSSVVKWLLKFETAMRPEDMQKQVEIFAKNYLSIESKNYGVAAVDSKADAQRIEAKDYVPNVLQMDRVTKRIYAFFNTNEKIVHSLYNENEWNSYYESVIKPLALQLSNEFTRMLFIRKERAEGNRIYFESSNLQCASINTKLNLV